MEEYKFGACQWLPYNGTHPGVAQSTVIVKGDATALCRRSPRSHFGWSHHTQKICK
jgi:hypothetical protein